MPPGCSICKHDRRQEIEDAVLRGHSHRAIALQFTLSRGGISRHMKHVSEAVNHAREVIEIEQGKSILAQLWELVSQARYLGARAERLGDYRISTRSAKRHGAFTGASRLG